MELNEGGRVVNLNGKKNEFLSQSFKNQNYPTETIINKEFDGCTFIECNFSESILRKCKFIDCHFVKCNLSLIKIEYSKFSDVTFTECKMIGVDWTKASWSKFALPSPINFEKCVINDSCFFGLSLEGLVIGECKAHDVDFSEGNFGEANFTYTDFSNSIFRNSNLSGADFTEATNYNIDIFLNEIKKAKFCRYEAMRLLDSLEIELVD